VGVETSLSLLKEEIICGFLVRAPGTNKWKCCTFMPSLSLSHSFPSPISHTHTRTNTHSDYQAHTHINILSVIHTHTFSCTFNHKLSLKHILSLVYTHTLPHSHTHSFHFKHWLTFHACMLFDSANDTKSFSFYHGTKQKQTKLQQ
jgi:hypothetical protein